MPAFPSDSGRIGRGALLAIFGAAFVIRAANAILLSSDPANFFLEDAQLYWPGSHYLLTTGHFDPPTDGGAGTGAPGSERVPFYLLFLAGLRFLFGDSAFACILVQCAVDAGTCVLIALLGAMIAPRVGKMAGALAAIWPTLIVLSASLLSDTLFLFVFTAMLLAAAHYLRRAEPVTAGATGVFCGLSIMTRTVTQFLPLAMVVVAPIIAWVQQRGTRTAIIATILFAIGATLPVMPWLARNVVTHDAWTLTTQDGTHVTGWLLPLIRQAQDGTPHEVAAREIEERYRARLAKDGIELFKLPAFERSRVLRQMGMEELKAIPFSVLAKAWIKGAVINLSAPAITIDPRVRRARTSSVYNDASPGLLGRAGHYLATTEPALRPWILAALIASGASLLLQATGFVMLARRLPWAAFFAAAVILYVLLVTGPIYSPKYRIPMEPVLIVLAALPLAALWAAMGRRRAVA